MSETEVQSLVIKINTENGEAVSGIDEVIAKLKALDGSISQKGAHKLTEISQSLKTLGNTFQQIKGVDKVSGLFNSLNSLDGEKAAKDILSVSNALGTMKENLSGLKRGANGIESLTAAFLVLPESLRTFGDASNYTSSLEQIKTTLDGLGEASKGAAKYGTGIYNIATGIRKLPEALAGMKEISKETIIGATQNIGFFVDNVSSSLERLDKVPASSFSNIATGMKDLSKAGADSDLVSNLSNAANAVASFSEKLSSSVKDETIARLSTLGNGVKNIADAYRGLSNKIPRVTKELKSQGTSVTSILNTIALSTRGFDSFFKDIGATKYFDDLMTGLGRISPMMNVFTTELSTVMHEVGTILTEDAPPMQRAIDGLSKAAIGASRRVLLLAGAPFKRLGDRIISTTAALKGLNSRIAKITLARAIRSTLTQVINGLKTGISNLYQWSSVVGNSFAPAMDSMASSMQYFKNSVGAMVSPLIESLAPALELIVDECVRTLNAINQLFAALSGASTWRKAVKQQVKFAEATHSANSSAKELKKTLLGFDEINALNGPPASGGGGGGASTPNYGGMFETETVDSKWKELANSSDWSILGERLAESLNDWEHNIDWYAIDKTAKRWSERIYTSFNGFIKKRDWKSLGVTIASGIGVGLEFLDDIAQNVNWDGFGSGIGTSMANAIYTLDWTVVGRSLTNGIKIAEETLNGFVKTMDWSALRQGVVTGIQSAFENVKWGRLIGNISDISHELLTTLQEAVAAIPWKKLGKALKKFDFEQFAKDVFKLIGEVVKGLSEADVLWLAGIPIALKLGGMLGGLGGQPALGAGISVLSAKIVMDIGKGVQTGDWYGFSLDVAPAIGAAIGGMVGGVPGAYIGSAIGMLADYIGVKFGGDVAKSVGEQLSQLPREFSKISTPKDVDEIAEKQIKQLKKLGIKMTSFEQEQLKERALYFAKQSGQLDAYYKKQEKALETFAHNVVYKWIVPTFEELKRKLQENNNGVSGAVDIVLEDIRAKVQGFWDWMNERTGGKLYEIKRKIEEHGGGIRGIWGMTADWIKSRWGGALDDNKSQTSKKLEDTKNNIVSKFNDIKSKTSKFTSDLSAQLKRTDMRLPQLTIPKNIVLPTFSWEKTLNAAKQVGLKLVASWHSKAMDNGMILNHPTIFGMQDGKALGAGEAGPEVVVGQRSLRGMINDAVVKATQVTGNNAIAQFMETVTSNVSNAGGNDGRPIEIPVLIDGEEVYRAVVKAKDNMSLRYHTV